MDPRIRKNIYYILPCFNEEAVLPETARRLKEKLRSQMDSGRAGAGSRIVFVDDGSSDATWKLICGFHREDPVFSGIRLSRNRGHQNALLAGMMTAAPYADAVITMDADLQDDIQASDAMIDLFLSGKDIVYGVRSRRSTDPAFKRGTAGLFYKVMKWMGADLVPEHADYRLLSCDAVRALSEFGEVNLFLRGMVPLLGFDSDVVYYERAERFAGKSKYPLKKMLQFATQGVTSFSTGPLQLITELGLFLFLVSIVMLIYSVVRRFMGATITGWASLMVSLWAIGGLNLFSIGIIGEYIGRIYLETKHRPRFIVTQFLDSENGFTYGNPGR